MSKERLKKNELVIDGYKVSVFTHSTYGDLRIKIEDISKLRKHAIVEVAREQTRLTPQILPV
jgi:hypothetical protein